MSINFQTTKERNECIRQEYANGMTLDDIRTKYDITVKQSHRIIWKKQYKTITDSNRQRDLKECLYCGVEFTPTKDSKVYCSEYCRDGNEKSTYKQTRRAKDKNVNIIDSDIALIKLFRKHKGLCALCGSACDWNDNKYVNGAFVAGNRYPTIDHKMPLSKGGDHSWENVQLVHKSCNEIKGHAYPYGG